jgi:hypothetical protein
MMGRLSVYGFLAMFILLGLAALVFYGGDAEARLVGLGFIGGGLLGIVVCWIGFRIQRRRSRRLTEWTVGQGTILAVTNSSYSTAAVNNSIGLNLTLSVEVPGRPPYHVTVQHSYSHDVRKQIQPGAIVPVRVNPANPAKVLVATDHLNRALV